MYAIGIDVGGSSLKCGVINGAGEVVYALVQPMSAAGSEAAIITLITAAIRQCAAVVPGAVAGVGIGFPGIVEDNVVIGGADNLPGFENVPLGKLLQQQTGYRIIIDNDANMMGFGELTYGAAKGCSDLVFLTVGTGIGGALVIDKKLYGGYKNRGTELGHMIIQHNGTRCSCGARGCFEAYASITALIRNYKALRNNKEVAVDGKMIVTRYLQHQPEAVAAMQKHFEYMAAGIAGLVNIFSPQKVVIGGGISEAGAFYIKEIATRVKLLAMPVTMQHTTLAAAALGNRAGLLGCAARVFRPLS
ncbi:sugar kinase [Niabella ginsenosidivorans]|uniref:Sugar kinase n=1 Tax=Niabella ginsenosidivorans TaxID=1176587 RepID=A0A1A9I7X0_9BACT|nr:sugar kinase [Niabella ginsenosidivorans]